MIPPCAFVFWLHGLHGEAFEEAVFISFFVCRFLSLLPGLWTTFTFSCFCQVGHQGERIDRVDLVELYQLILATLEDTLLSDDGVVTRLHTTFHMSADSTDGNLLELCCYNGFTLSKFLVLHIPLFHLQAHCKARIILGAGPYSVITFIPGFGKHLL
jgi:hypothetical protein